MANDATKASGQGTASSQKSEAAEGSSAKTGMTLVVDGPLHIDAFVVPAEGDDGEEVRFDRSGTHVSSKAKAEEYIQRAALSGVALIEKVDD